MTSMLRILFAVCCLCVASIANAADPDAPIRWTFDSVETLPGQVSGKADVVSSELRQPRYPGFAGQNKVLELKSPSWVAIPDDSEAANFDFDNGDAVTFEAWVRIDSFSDNVYLIGKGRTGTSGRDAINQNWAFRLRKNNGRACVNFLFRSRANDAHDGDWHRWTSKSGFSSGSRWHHVAVSYRFGSPESILGYIDGKIVTGSWDMGGATDQPPVVDDAEVWIGSSMGGSKGNSLHGAIDNVTIHRRELSSDELMSRFQWNPPPVKAPVIPKGKVVVELFGGVDSISRFPLETSSPLTTWQQEEFAFIRLPQRYDAWGVRDDWGKTLLVRAWADVQLPQGEHRLMLRSRGLARLKIDGEQQIATKTQPNRGGAHHVVDDIPSVPVPGMRPHAMNDQEIIVPFTSDGRSHRFLLEMIVGGPNYRAEFGENSLSVAAADSMFHVVSETSQYPLTDDGWQTFVADASAKFDAMDRGNRTAANMTTADYWSRRHQHARATLLTESRPSDIDAVIQQRLNRLNANAAAQQPHSTPADAEYFTTHIQPIFDAHCTRCHDQKEQGQLLITNRNRLLQGGESGEAAIVPGQPEESYLFQLVSAAADDYRMPPKGDGLSESEVAAVRQWIANGAEMPDRSPKMIEQPAIVDDHSFLRRVFIDTVGVPPTLAEAELFFSDSEGTRRSRLIERMLRDDRWADNWVGYWQDVLAENPNLLKPTLNNTGPFRYWIHDALTDNKSIDRFATELMMMRGSRWGGGSAGFSVASQNDVPMAAKAHVIGSAFLGVNMQCARCHDAPYHAWKQSDLFQLAAMLDRKTLKLPKSSTVPAAFFEKQARQSLIEVSLKAGAPIDAHFPFADLAPDIEASLLERPEDTREQLAARVTSSRRFAEVIANRIWKRFMGAGLVEPVDDWEGNPPSDPHLMAALTDLLIDSDYDVKRFSGAILNSQVYQRVAIDRPSHRDRHFAGPYRRRMSAEQIVDSALHVVGQPMQTEQLTMDVEGTLPADRFLNFGFPQRSWQFTTLANERDRPSLALPRVQAIADVLKAFGWRNSRPEPATDREEAPNLIQPGVLANGTLGVWLTTLTDDGGLTKLMLQQQPVESLVDSLFLQLLTRKPTTAEQEKFVALLALGYDHRVVPLTEIGTAPPEPRFPYVSWSNHLNTEANRIKVEMEELVRNGPPPTRYLKTEWQQRASDAVWSLLNSPEMVLIP